MSYDFSRGGTPELTIAVATHKPYRMPVDPIYLPLHVGTALHPDVCPDMQGDDTADSISERNPYYSELTGLWWLWRNVEADHKGLVHYRRHLGSPDRARRRAEDPLDRVVTGEELLPLLERHGVVVARRRSYYIETVYGHYAHTFDARQFDECRAVLSDLSPEHVSHWDRLMRSRGAHIFNMFVMRSDLLDAYCSWLFPVLFELERRIDPASYDAFGARYLGRVSERLLDPWLWANGITPAELPVVSPEPVDWVAKGRGFLAAKFLGRKYERSF
ncbi:DUF4422 domain-containing protein [Thermophilibacter sp.]